MPRAARKACPPPPTVTPRRRRKSTAEVGTDSVGELAPVETPSVEQVDTGYLESLIGYNARRATLVILDAFMQQMAVYGLKPVDFSVLSLIHHNPGITSRQLCHTLGIQPPNLVGMVGQLEKRGLIVRQTHPRDRRAIGLHLSPDGLSLVEKAEKTAAELEDATSARLSASERATLMRLLQKIYRDDRLA